MPSLDTAGSITTMSSTGTSTYTGSSTTTQSATSSAYVYSYGTSKIVRTAVAAGVIVLALTALVLFIKISSWIRFHQRLRRHSQLTLSLQSEQRATAYEIAAWADEPNTAPVKNGDYNKKSEKKSRKERREEIKQIRRGGGNAWMVKEWEGVAS